MEDERYLQETREMAALMEELRGPYSRSPGRCRPDDRRRL